MTISLRLSSEEDVDFDLKKMVTDASFLDFDSTPDVVFLQIGGNDIRRNTDPNRLASYILSIGEYLVLGLGVQLVIIRRAPHATCAGYTRTVFDVNGILRQRISGVRQIKLWNNRGF